MLERISIQNFKSVRNVELEAGRVNLFIGEPNSGKSNILEALALLCGEVYAGQSFKEVFRFKTLADLFWDQDISNAIVVETSAFKFSFTFSASTFFTGTLAPKGTGAKTSGSFRHDGKSRWS